MTSPFFSGEILPSQTDVDPNQGPGSDFFESFVRKQSDPNVAVLSLSIIEHPNAVAPFEPAAVQPELTQSIVSDGEIVNTAIETPKSVYYRFQFTPDDIPSNDPSQGIEVDIEEVRFIWQIHARLRGAETGSTQAGNPGLFNKILVFDRKEPRADGKRQTTFLPLSSALFPTDPNILESSIGGTPVPFQENGVGSGDTVGWNWARGLAFGQSDSPWKGSGGFPNYRNITRLRHQPSDVNIWQGGAYFKDETEEPYWSQGVSGEIEFFNIDGINPVIPGTTANATRDWQSIPEGLVPEMLNGDTGHFGVLMRRSDFGFFSDDVFLAQQQDRPVEFFGPYFVSVEIEVDYNVNNQGTQTARAPRDPVGDLGDEARYDTFDAILLPPPGSTPG